jgi:hypothetical protein
MNRPDSYPWPFIEIEPWGGRIGAIRWCNSEPSPHPSLFSRRTVVYWGCFLWRQPREEIMYGKEVPLEDD